MRPTAIPLMTSPRSFSRLYEQIHFEMGNRFFRSSDENFKLFSNQEHIVDTFDMTLLLILTPKGCSEEITVSLQFE